MSYLQPLVSLGFILLDSSLKRRRTKLNHCVPYARQLKHPEGLRASIQKGKRIPQILATSSWRCKGLNCVMCCLTASQLLAVLLLRTRLELEISMSSPSVGVTALSLNEFAET